MPHVYFLKSLHTISELYIISESLYIGKKEKLLRGQIKKKERTD